MNFLTRQISSQKSCLSTHTISCTRYQSQGSRKRAIASLIPIRSLATVTAQAALQSSEPINTYGSSTMPPGHQASVGNLRTFYLPHKITGSLTDRNLGKEMIDAWRKDGIFQVAMTPTQENICEEALVKSKDFFKQPQEWKASHVDSKSFAGYIASGEELTDGIADYSEIFTVTKDLPESDSRVQAKWPCHGPCPWPGQGYKQAMENLMDQLGENGEKLLKLAALGLDLDSNTLTQLTDDGWHHMRILR
jgi:isopenicillin N synthase-like dioxygenase